MKVNYHLLYTRPVISTCMTEIYIVNPLRLTMMINSIHVFVHVEQSKKLNLYMYLRNVSDEKDFLLRLVQNNKLKRTFQNLKKTLSRCLEMSIWMLFFVIKINRFN